MIAVLGFFAAVLSITVVWPQVWLSCRHGRTLGLSPTGSWFAVGLNLCWLTFGLLTRDPAQIATHAVLGAGSTDVAGLPSAVVTLVGIVGALPQLLGILFDRTEDLSGMSAARWYLGAGSCASWTAYGWLLSQPTVWLSAGFGLVCAVVTCVVLRSRQTAPAVRTLVPVGPAARRTALAAA